MIAVWGVNWNRSNNKYSPAFVNETIHKVIMFGQQEADIGYGDAYQAQVREIID